MLYYTINRRRGNKNSFGIIARLAIELDYTHTMIIVPAQMNINKFHLWFTRSLRIYKHF